MAYSSLLQQLRRLPLADHDDMVDALGFIPIFLCVRPVLFRFLYRLRQVRLCGWRIVWGMFRADVRGMVSPEARKRGMTRFV